MVGEGKEAFAIVEPSEIVNDRNVLQDRIRRRQFLRFEGKFTLDYPACFDVLFEQFLRLHEFCSPARDESFQSAAKFLKFPLITLSLGYVTGNSQNYGNVAGTR